MLSAAKNCDVFFSAFAAAAKGSVWNVFGSMRSKGIGFSPS
jgi:hypothetical protein